MDQPLFQKTARGRQVLQSHDRTLDSRSRQLLILCNGCMPLAELRTVLGEQTDALLHVLLARGLVERVAPSPVEQAPVTQKARPAAAAKVQAAPTPPAGIDLPAAKARALDLLERLFGPGGGSHGQAVLQAGDAAAFEQVLQGVHEAISIYQGKKRAALLVQQIRNGA